MYIYLMIFFHTVRFKAFPILQNTKHIRKDIWDSHKQIPNIFLIKCCNKLFYGVKQES